MPKKKKKQKVEAPLDKDTARSRFIGTVGVATLGVLMLAFALATELGYL